MASCAFSTRMGMSGLIASMTSLTCDSTDLNGSMWIRASAIAFSIRWGGWGPLVWGLIALRTISATTFLRIASVSSRRWSVVSWISPFFRIVRMILLWSVVLNAFNNDSSDAWL